MKNGQTYNIALSILLHLSLFFFLFFHNQHTFTIPGEKKTIIHAYIFTEPLQKKQPKKTIDLRSKLKNPKQHTHEITVKPKSIKQHHTTKRSSIQKNEEIFGDKINQLVIIIYKAINQHKKYPLDNETSQHAGRVIVTFILQPDGKISHLHLSKSSGFRNLDQSAIATIKASQPIANISHLLKHPQEFSIPIDYA